MKTFEQLVAELPEWAGRAGSVAVNPNRHVLYVNAHTKTTDAEVLDILPTAEAAADMVRQLNAYLRLISSDS